jgi:hypothetical protein
MKTSFFKGESVNFSITIKKSEDNTLTDPTSVFITILKNVTGVGATDIVKVNQANMIKSSVGKYKYDWISDATGEYTVVYKADNSSKITISKDYFTVV